MGFKKMYDVPGYKEYLDALDSGGLCMGMSYLWAFELITGRAESMRQPCFNEGEKLHFEYLSVTTPTCAFSRLFSGAADRAFFLKQKNKNSSSKIKFQVGVGCGDSIRNLDSLKKCPGDAAIVMVWLYKKESHCFDRVIKFYDSGHVVALYKKYDAISLYDPNFGVFRWVPSQGVSLKNDVQNFLSAKPYGKVIWPDATLLMQV